MANNSGWFSWVGLRRGPSRATSSNRVRRGQSSRPVEALESRELLAVGLPTGFEETMFAEGLSTPTDMAFAPDGRLFVAEKGGRVRVVENGVLLEDPFLTIAPHTEGERGLLGIIFDPDFETNGYLYIYYTRAGDDPANRLSRFTVSNFDDNIADPTSELVLLDDIPVFAAIHNGGAMGFGHDGMLYLGIGDGFLSEDVQDLSSLNGKLLRLDVSNPDNIIPADNPFLATPGARGEIYALGLRNPFKLDVDPETGKIWVTNTGDDSFEEIHEVRAGANYGWPLYEGPVGEAGYDDPVFSYPYLTNGGSITAGVFYRGNQLPTEYDGDFFFADFSHQAIRRIDVHAHEHMGHDHEHELTATDFARGLSGPVDLEVGNDGALYYLDVWTGTVTRFAFTGGSNRAPEAVATANQTVGDSPFMVTFDASGSSDPDSDSLTYTWDFGDGSALVTGMSVMHTYAVSGIYNARVTVDDGNGGTDVSDPITIAVDEHPPVGSIVLALENPLYRGGDTIGFSATGTDAEDGPLPPSAFTWKIVFHHNTHTHPFMGPLTGTNSGSFEIPVIGETSANVWYRVHLTVTDSSGLTHESFVDVFPQVSQITINTSPALPQLLLDGEIMNGPVTFDGVTGISRRIEAPLLQFHNGQTYLFQSWSNGRPRAHTLATPATDTTLTANYQLLDAERATASFFVAGLYEKILSRPGDASGLNFHVNQLLAGKSRDSVIRALWLSSEHRRMQVTEMYMEFLDRTPATEEVNYWTGQFEQGMSELDVAARILSSSEFVTLLRVRSPNYVSDVFELALKQTGSAEEMQPWIDLLDDGSSHMDVARGLLTTADRYNVLLNQQYLAFLDRAPLAVELTGDFHSGQGSPVELLARSILGSGEFLTKQVARPVVAAMYDDVLHRSATNGEIDHWVNQLLGGKTRQSVVSSFQQSREALGNFVRELYVRLLERLPTESELNNRIDSLLGGLSERDMVAHFLTSTEYGALHPDNAGFVSSLYGNLFNRAASASELVYWAAETQGGMTREQVVRRVLASVEYRSGLLREIYSDYLDRLPSAREIDYWINEVKQTERFAATLRTKVLSSQEYYIYASVDMTAENRDLERTENLAYVSNLYIDLFDRNATSYERAAWHALLRSGVTQLTVATQLWNSAERATMVAMSLYEDLLGRLASEQERDVVAAELLLAGHKLGTTLSLIASTEYNALYPTNQAFVGALFDDLLGRTADGSGQQWWLDRMNNGATRNTIASTIQRSPEAWTRLVENVFDEFLHRDANSTELVTWINLLASGSRTERDLAIALMTSDEYGS